MRTSSKLSRHPTFRQQDIRLRGVELVRVPSLAHLIRILYTFTNTISRTMSTEATTGDKRKAEEQTVTATDDDAKKSVQLISFNDVTLSR